VIFCNSAVFVPAHENRHQPSSFLYAYYPLQDWHTKGVFFFLKKGKVVNIYKNSKSVNTKTGEI
jgi:hypothetical protein